MCVLFEQLKKRRRLLLWLAALGLLLGWSLTWALDSPQRPVLAERDDIRAAAVHISGVACGQFSEGSGFAVESGLVLTSAHVVAGVEEIKVSAPDGSSGRGVLVGFDPGRDAAAISVSGLDLSPVAMAPAVAVQADEGDVGTVDRDTGLEFEPYRVLRRIPASGVDIYEEEAENRYLLEVRSLLAAGDSGAALVNVDGEVVGMVYAVARGQRDQAYALDRNEIVEFLAEIDRAPLPVPPCHAL
ncbi:MAG: trypsin-like peptidase domain-containing protein [Acidimicrobiia bacterium]|nr:trypsin-like peptidase domain-containing protein [Acidimicrobiia bacterium]MYB74383.1 trypsin-like peptidase domain-containing protein [Acidimicrobiia bacterium]MYH99426.1 trypsin-like peptidase domain-containing protein [Acidimicrobiia bacterium]